jgi:hypothetical protein
MKARQQIRILIITLLSFSTLLTANSQISSSFYTDFGCNNLSHGVYINSAIIIDYSLNKTTCEGGIRTNIKNNIKSGFSGFTINLSRKIIPGKLPLEIKGFYTITNPVGILKETNWGGQMSILLKHFDMSSGVDFKSFRFSNKSDDPKRGDQKINEVYNIIYSISYHVRPTSENWNISLTLTNIDNFSISQETNPEINLTGLFRFKTGVSVYAQGWYEPAGLTNRVPDKFGYFFRTGVIWKIN